MCTFADVELCCLSLGGGEKAALEGKKWPNRASFICCWVSAPGREGNRGGAWPEAKPFAVHMFWGVAESSNEDQCLFFATLMALKWPVLEMFAVSLRAIVPCLWASRSPM